MNVCTLYVIKPMMTYSGLWAESALDAARDPLFDDGGRSSAGSLGLSALDGALDAGLGGGVGELLGGGEGELAPTGVDTFSTFSSGSSSSLSRSSSYNNRIHYKCAYDIQLVVEYSYKWGLSCCLEFKNKFNCIYSDKLRLETYTAVKEAVLRILSTWIIDKTRHIHI